MPEGNREKSLCVLPWIQRSVYPNGSALPCCLMINQFKKTQWNKLNETPSFFKEIRSTMRAGQLPQSCQDCKKAEASGLQSYREMANRDWPEELMAISRGEDPKVKKVELRLSNRCNFSCRTCNAASSTGWYPDAKFLGLDRHAKEQSLKDELGEAEWSEFKNDLYELEEIHFMGGEPLLQNEHWEILEEFPSHKKNKTSLHYVTNLSSFSFSQDRARELWGGFRQVYWDVSLDGLGAKGEFIRKGLKWELFKKNLNKLLEFRKELGFEVGASITVSCLNFLDLVSVVDFFLDNKVTRMNFNMVTSPSHYSPETLSPELKKLGSKRLSDYIDRKHKDFERGEIVDLLNQLQGIIQWVDNSDTEENKEGRSKFWNMTHVLDELRGESIDVVLPELTRTHKE